MDRRGDSCATACRSLDLVRRSSFAYVYRVLFLLLGAQSSAAHAESVSYHGVPIEVDALSVRVAGFDTITLAGEETLVPLAEAGRWAALQLLKKASASAPFPCDTGVAVFTKASEHGDIEVMREVMLAAGQRALCTEDRGSSLLEVSISSARAHEMLSSFLANGGDLGAPNPLLCDAFELATAPGRSLPAVPPSICDYCSKRLSKRVLAGLLQRGDVVGSHAELERGVKVFGCAGLPENESLERLSSLIRALQRAADQGNVERFDNLKQTLTQRAAQLGLASNDERVDEWFIARGLDRGDSAAVSRCIAAMVFERRSPAMHEYVLQLIRMELEKGINLNNFFLVQTSLAQYAAKDEEIAPAYRELVGAAIEKSLHESRSKEAISLANTAGVPLSWSLRLRLFLASWESAPNVGAFSVIALVACGLVVWSLKRRRPPRVVEGSTAESARAHSEEYLKALSTFGLKPGASIAEIKNAYRSEIKQFHPDVASGKSDEARQRFIELTNQYEYLLSCSAGKNRQDI